MTETSAVWSVMALSSALTATMPDSSTGSSVVVQPRRASARSVFRTASCSIALAIRWRRPRASAASATPRMAALSASVPPLVKTISEGSPLSERRNRGPGLVERRLGLLAEEMHTRRVSEYVARHASHRLRYFRRQGSRRVVVKIDTHRESFIVANPLTDGGKRTRQRFSPAPILTGLFRPDIALGGTIARQEERASARGN